jgi:hypothetical protein
MHKSLMRDRRRAAMGSAQSRAMRDARFVDARCDDVYRCTHCCALLDALTRDAKCTDAPCAMRHAPCAMRHAPCAMRHAPMRDT